MNELKQKIIEICKEHIIDMSQSYWHGENMGIPEDEIEDIADEIIKHVVDMVYQAENVAYQQGYTRGMKKNCLLYTNPEKSCEALKQRKRELDENNSRKKA